MMDELPIVTRLTHMGGLCDRHVVPHVGHGAICREAATLLTEMAEALRDCRAEVAIMHGWVSNESIRAELQAKLDKVDAALAKVASNG